MNHQDLINTCAFEQFEGLLFSDLSGPLRLRGSGFYVGLLLRLRESGFYVGFLLRLRESGFYVGLLLVF